jgi:hypothetical protein
MKVTAQQVLDVGISGPTNPANKTTGDGALAQAVINLSDVLKLLTLVVIDIRDKQ